MTSVRRTEEFFRHGAVYLLLFIAFAGMAGARSISAGVDILNGSFEDPDTGGGVIYNPVGAGWVFTPQAGVIGSGYISGLGPPPDGVQAGLLQVFEGGLTTQVISQTLTNFTVGDSYNVSFYIAPPTWSGQITAMPVDVTMGDNDLGTYMPGAAWMPVTTSAFTATDTSYTLAFTGLPTVEWPYGIDQQGALLDLVVVNDLGPGGAPEPASFGMMLLGGAALVALGRLRQR